MKVEIYRDIKGTHLISYFCLSQVSIGRYSTPFRRSLRKPRKLGMRVRQPALACARFS